MTTSNSSEPVTTPTEGNVASVSDTGVNETTTTVDTNTHEEGSIAEAIAAQAKKDTVKTPTETEEAVAQEPEYKPNFHFKAYGKEYEIDDLFRGVIKDAESEKKVKDVFTKAYAFDDLKQKHDATQTEYHSLRSEFDELDSDVRKVVTFLQNKDFDNVFASLGVEDEEVFKWVQNKLELLKLAPEQRQLVEAQAQERLRAYELEAQHQALNSQYQSQATQARAMQLDMVMGRPEVSQAASAWDSRTGEMGSFRNLVIEEAQKAWYSYKQDLSAEQAVGLVLQKYGKLLDGNMTQPQAGQSPQATMQSTQSPQATQKPVIPAVNGRGTSPIKQAPKSLDDLRNLARQMEANV